MPTEMCFVLAIAGTIIFLQIARFFLWISKQGEQSKKRAQSKHNAQMRANGKLMIERAQSLGKPLFCINHTDMTAGICPHRLFEDSYRSTRNALEAEGDDALTKRIVVHVKPTYTYWLKDSHETLMHTGGKHDLESLVARIVVGITRIPRHEVSKKDFDIATESLIARTGQLFVPYAGGGANREASKAAGHTRHSVVEAQKTLLAIVPNDHSLF